MKPAGREEWKRAAIDAGYRAPNEWIRTWTSASHQRIHQRMHDQQQQLDQQVGFYQMLFEKMAPEEQRKFLQMEGSAADRKDFLLRHVKGLDI